MTRGIWHMVGGENFLKISAPKLIQFGIDSVWEILNERLTQSMNEWVTEVIVEQPRLHRVC